MAPSRATANGTAPIVLVGNQTVARSNRAFSQLTANTHSEEVHTSGVSHPGDDASAGTNDAAAGDAASTPQSVVVRRQPAAQAFASAPVDATVPQPKVVTGFGAELASSSPRTIGGYTQPSQSQTFSDDGDIVAGNEGAAVRTLADDAVQPLATPLYTRSGKLMMPAPLKGSREILVHQNEMADHDGLQRIQNDRELNRLTQSRQLVSFPETASLRVNEGLPENRRYARPWTVKFAADTARAFYAEFGQPLQVNSAVRTAAYQLRLQRVNGNAAAVNGDGASPHLTGQAIDFGKRGMSSEEIAWMRTYLMPLIEAGKVDVEEEFQQACFHISVYKAYMPAIKRRATAHVQVAQLHSEVKTSSAEETER
ncbi:MAG TPA: DUF5715 family protein [Acidobacteriaceae bacterium]